MVTLFETTHPGLFRGYITLVTGSAGSNQLRVQNGDTITATYFDLSNNSNVTATAAIDTVPPVISQVAATTDYYNAKVTWRTSKPADSSVQYGVSPLPDRSSYLSAPVPITPSPSAGFPRTGLIIIKSSAATRRAIPPWTTTTEIFTRSRRSKRRHRRGSTIWRAVRPAGRWFPTRPRFRYQLDTRHARQWPGDQRPFRINAWGSDLDGDQDFFIASTFLYAPGHRSFRPEIGDADFL